jgi:hypothetical protein
MNSYATRNSSQFHRDMNRVMIEVVPELNSEWALTPMAYDRWRRPDEVVDNGDPCFIESAQDKGPKKDYIYMAERKDLKPGYYHLRTQEAYVEVYYRFCQNSPSFLSLCCKPRKAAAVADDDKEKTYSRKEFKQAKEIIYNRVIAKEPNDVLSARLAALRSVSAGGEAAAFGKAMYLPTLTTTVLLSLAHF